MFEVVTRYSKSIPGVCLWVTHFFEHVECILVWLEVIIVIISLVCFNTMATSIFFVFKWINIWCSWGLRSDLLNISWWRLILITSVAWFTCLYHLLCLLFLLIILRTLYHCLSLLKTYFWSLWLLRLLRTWKLFRTKDLIILSFSCTKKMFHGLIETVFEMLKSSLYSVLWKAHSNKILNHKWVRFKISSCVIYRSETSKSTKNWRRRIISRSIWTWIRSTTTIAKPLPKSIA